MKPWLMLVVIAVAAGLGVLAGLGGAAVLAALPAMFCLMAAFGGTRYADLRLLAWFGPLLVLVVGGLRSLVSVAAGPAMALVTLIVFAAGMLPLLGPRLTTVGMGLGMASTFAYGFQSSGSTTAVQDFIAPALSVGVVVVTRALLGLRDPEGPLRTAFSAALTSDADTAWDSAHRQWVADGPRGWSTAALTGILRYRNAVRVLRTRRPMLHGPSADELDEVLTAAEAEAERLAGEVGMATATDPRHRVRRREPRLALPGATRELVTSAWLGLESVQAATCDRDRSRVDLPPHAGREPLSTVLRGAATWHSPQLRHAVRCALGMLVAMLVSQLFAGDPLRMTFLVTVFAIMQPQLQDSIVKAKQRVIGALAGAAALAMLVVLVQLPQPALMPIGLVAMLIGFLFFMQTKPMVFNACMVLMSIGMNVNTRHLELGPTLLDYLLLMALAVAIALGFGFLAVPGVRRVSLAVRYAEAVEESRTLLREVAAALVTHEAEPRKLGPGFRAVSAAHQNLRSTDAMQPIPSEDEQKVAQTAADAVQSLSASASALIMRPANSATLAGAVGEIARQLGTETDPSAVFDRAPAVIDLEQQLLLDTMIANSATLGHAASRLPAPA